MCIVQLFVTSPNVPETPSPPALSAAAAGASIRLSLIHRAHVVLCHCCFTFATLIRFFFSFYLISPDKNTRTLSGAMFSDADEYQKKKQKEWHSRQDHRVGRRGRPSQPPRSPLRKQYSHSRSMHYASRSAGKRVNTCDQSCVTRCVLLLVRRAGGAFITLGEAWTIVSAGNRSFRALRGLCCHCSN